MYGQKRILRVAAWLALLSVAMLFIAPVVSKSLAHQSACQHSKPAMMMAHSAMGHDMAMPEECQGNADMAHRMLSGQAMSPMEEIACGYCQLLIHLPFVALILAVLLWLLLIFVCRAPVLHLIPSPVFRAWTPQRARAPPAVFLISL